VYDFYEEYLNVNTYLVLDLVYIGVGVFAVSTVFLLSVQASLIMLLDLVIILVQTYGFLAFWDIKINDVCIVNLMLAVALSVDLTARVVRVFTVAKGTRQERMKHTVVTLTVPITHSAAAMFLCDFSMAFASFPYFRIYFFNMYLYICVFSFINGVLLLPVLMNWLGPAPIVIDEPTSTNYGKLEEGKQQKGPTPLLKD